MDREIVARELIKVAKELTAEDMSDRLYLAEELQDIVDHLNITISILKDKNQSSERAMNNFNRSKNFAKKQLGRLPR